MSSLRKLQLRATIVGHFGVIILLVGGAIGSSLTFYVGGAVIALSLIAVLALWLIMWRRGE